MATDWCCCSLRAGPPCPNIIQLKYCTAMQAPPEIGKHNFIAQVFLSLGSRAHPWGYVRSSAQLNLIPNRKWFSAPGCKQSICVLS